MKIAIVGLTDKLRDELLAVCESRGIEVLPEKDVLKLTEENLRALDAVIDATDPSQLEDTDAFRMQSSNLAELLTHHPEKRFLRIGEKAATSNETVFCPPERMLPPGRNH